MCSQSESLHALAPENRDCGERNDEESLLRAPASDADTSDEEDSNDDSDDTLGSEEECSSHASSFLTPSSSSTPLSHQSTASSTSSTSSTSSSSPLQAKSNLLADFNLSSSTPIRPAASLSNLLVGSRRTSYRGTRASDRKVQRIGGPLTADTPSRFVAERVHSITEVAEMFRLVQSEAALRSVALHNDAPLSKLQHAVHLAAEVLIKESNLSVEDCYAFASHMFHIHPDQIRKDLKRYQDDIFYEPEDSQRGCHAKTFNILVSPELTDELRILSDKLCRENPRTFNGYLFAAEVNKLASVKSKLLAEVAHSAPAECGAKRRRVAGSPITYFMALKWLKDNGFFVDRSAGLYVDGHNSDEVVKYRNEFLARFKVLQDSGRLVWHKPTDAEVQQWSTLKGDNRKIIVLSQDESCVYAKDQHFTSWSRTNPDGTLSFGKFKTKSLGQTFMISCFFDSCTGGPASWIDEQTAEWTYHFFEAGKGAWWTSEKMLAETLRVIRLLEKVYPWAQFLFLFDWSTNHTARMAGVPDETKMNLTDGGTQPVCKPQVFQGHTFTFTVPDPANEGAVIQMGLESLARQRNLVGPNESVGRGNGRLNKEQLQARVGALPDFVYYRSMNTALHCLVQGEGHLCDFYPKFHCELSAAEPCWAAIKRVLRFFADGKAPTMRQLIPLAMKSLCEQSVRRFFNKCVQVGNAYRAAFFFEDILELNKVQSHRQYSSFGDLDKRWEALKSKYPGICREELDGACGCDECKGVVDARCRAPYCADHNDAGHEDLKEALQQSLHASNVSGKGGARAPRGTSDIAKAGAATRSQELAKLAHD